MFALTATYSSIEKKWCWCCKDGLVLIVGDLDSVSTKRYFINVSRLLYCTVWKVYLSNDIYCKILKFYFSVHKMVVGQSGQGGVHLVYFIVEFEILQEAECVTHQHHLMVAYCVMDLKCHQTNLGMKITPKFLRFHLIIWLVIKPLLTSWVSWCSQRSWFAEKYHWLLSPCVLKPLFVNLFATHPCWYEKQLYI